MFQNITNKLGRAFAWVLILLIAFSFVIWGVGDVFRNFGSDHAAIVGNSKISLQELREATQKQAAQLRSVLKDTPLTAEMEKEIELATLDSLIKERLLALELENMKIIVGDKQIANIIYSEPAFRDEEGNFSAQKFKDFLSNSGKSEGQYINYIKFQMASSALFRAIGNINFIPKSMIEAAYLHDNENRVIKYAVFSKNFVKDLPAATDAELSQFYDKKREMFSVPEQRDISYLEISKDTVKPQAITEEQVKNEYENQKKSYVKQEVRTLEQLFFTSEDEAKKAYKQLLEGKDMKSLEKEGQYTVLEKVNKQDLPKEVGVAGFSLTLDRVSQPVKSSLGWHILKAKEIKALDFPPYEKLKKDIRDGLAEKNESEYLYNTSVKIEDELAAGSSLEDVSKKFNIPLRRMNNIVRNTNSGKNPLESSGEFIQAAFLTPEGADSGIRTTKEGNGFVLHVDRVVPSRIRALDEVRGLVEQAWKEESKDQLVKKEADAIAAKIKGKNDFERIISQAGLGIKKTPPLKRGNADGVLPEAFVEQVFSSSSEEIKGPFGDGKGDYYIGIVEKVERPDIAKADKDVLAKISQNLEKDYADDIYEQYFAYLKSKYSVKLGNVVKSGT